MPVQDHLKPNEVVLASSGLFHATDQRLIRFEERPLTGMPAQSLRYGEVQELRNGVQTRYRMVILSFVLFLLGILDSGRVSEGFKAIMILVGLVGIIYGILSRKTVWTVVSSTLNKNEQSRWRIVEESNERFRKLIQVVQSHVGRPVEPEHPTLPTDSSVQAGEQTDASPEKPQ